MIRPAFLVATLLFALVLPTEQGRGQPGRADVRATFDWTGCSVEERSGTVRAVHCASFTMRVWRAPTLADAPGLAAIAATLPGAGGGAPGEIRAGSATAPSWESAEVLLAATLPGVAAACAMPAGAGREACRAAMGEMVRSRTLPPGVSFPEPQLRFLGGELVVPEGCTLMSPERIGCATTGAALDWREQAAREGDTAEDMLATVTQVMRSRLAIVEETPIACSLRGIAATGIRLRAEVSGQLLDIATCAVVRGGTKSLAQCIGRLPSGRPWPTPCASVFDGMVP